jgi:hypothetical protein
MIMTSRNGMGVAELWRHSQKIAHQHLCDTFEHGLYGKFAAILQEEIRQRVSRVRMLMIVVCEENMRSRLAV